MSVSLEKPGIWSNIGQHMEKTLRSMIKFTIARLYSTIIFLPY